MPPQLPFVANNYPKPPQNQRRGSNSSAAGYVPREFVRPIDPDRSTRPLHEQCMRDNVRQYIPKAQQQGGYEQRIRDNGDNRGKDPRRRRRPVRRMESDDGSEQEKSMRDRLIHQLENNRYECAICCQVILAKQAIWSCKTCYHMFHITGGCVINWAKKSKEDDNRWRCPTCQTKYDAIPYNYFCFCRKQRNPTPPFGETPHSCGNVCGGQRAPGCPHPCNESCHPGPCPECPVMLTRSCNCGNVQKAIRCGSVLEVKCDKVCNRLLACGEHRCNQICHEGDCSPCEVTFVQTCYCGSSSREILCFERGFSEKYSCGSPCSGMYNCGIHRCTRNCHSTSENGCGPCPSAPERIINCPCGRSTLAELGVARTSCEDPVPTCRNICAKVLKCGSVEKKHRCRALCHSGDCPPCELTTSVICRCKQVKRTLPCSEYVQFAGFEEQYCHCGRTMRPPPVPCGAPLPECYEPCARPHSCNHPVTHRCHGEERCPPCTALVERMCYGKHELRKNIPCHIDAVSCGRLCDKPLGCGVHNCTRNCHAGDCMKEGEKCTKPCKVLRQSCEHPCALPCHGTEPCPESECRFPLNVTCECGKRKSILKCSEFEKVIARLRAVEAEDSEGDPSNTAAGVGTLKRSASTEKLNCLPCDDDCKKVARNKKLAEALQLVTDENGMLEREPTITFTEYMKAELRTNAAFVCEIEKTFMELLEKIEDPTFLGSSLNHNFRPMSVELRRFIHEYAEFFSIDTVSVDDPPKRSIIATAKRGISRAPLVLLTSLQKYPNMLKSSGSVTLKSGFGDDSKKKSEQSEQESSSTSSMKALRGARLFKKRVAPQIARPSPLPQFNHFAVLLSDDEDTPSPQANQTSRPAPYQNLMLEKDPDWWSDDEEPLSGESGEYDEIESLMNDLVLEVCKSEEPDTCKNCKDSWSDDE
ncbi:hypothetical protein Q1695_015515 [Nippostrongylus brasiliensis]|nr:hypothetical protein Q1695_015515 [Nippostrongylus brasiliensis]